MLSFRVQLLLKDQSTQPYVESRITVEFGCIYKLFYEALNRSLISKLVNESENHLKNWFEENEVIMSTFDASIYEELKEEEEFQSFHRKFLDLKKNWSEGNSSLRKFWLSFIEMVDLMLSIIYACRAGKWDLLLECIREVIPYAFAYDHFNYARFLTIMLGDMLALEEDYPDVYSQFVLGNFSVQLSENPFSCTESDKVIEMTLNRDSKTPGGTTGFSVNTNECSETLGDKFFVSCFPTIGCTKAFADFN